MKIVKVDEALEFANTFYGDPILKMAINAVLNNMPAADAAEIIHGQWIAYYTYSEDPHDRLRYRCSLCGRTEEYQEPYCNCGAKMDIIL